MLASTQTSPAGPPRISQVLPTVKCSNCNQPVPVNELVEHTCSAVPPVPSLPSSTNNSGGLKGRLQGFLATPPSKPAPTNPIPSPPASPKTPAPPKATPPKALPPRAPFASNSNRPGSNSSFQLRSSPLARSFSDDSDKDYFFPRGNDSELSKSVPGPSSLHKAGKASVSSFRSATSSVKSGKSSSSGGRDSVRDTIMSSHSSSGNRNRDTVSSTGTVRPPLTSSRSNSPAPGNLPPMSPTSPLSAQRSPASPGYPPASPRIPESRTMSPLSPLSALSNAATVSAMSSMSSSSSAPSALNVPPALRPSFSRIKPEPVNVSRGPSTSNESISPLNNGQSLRGSPMPSLSSFAAPPRGVLSPGPSHVPGPSNHTIQPSIHHEEPDTKIGGEAGMAGVGRRGFAAVARAALFTSNMGTPNGIQRGPFLDIDAAIRTTGTPPLTATSLSPQSIGPVSPLSPPSTSPTSMQTLQGLPAGKAEGGFFDKFRNRVPSLGISENDSYPTDDVPTAKAGPGGGSVTPRARPVRQGSDASETSTSSALTLGLAYSTSNASSSRSGGTSRHRIQKSLTGITEDGDTSESEYGGLAYADSDSTDHEDEKDGNPRLSFKSGLSSGTRNSRNGLTPTPRQRPISGSVYSDDDDESDDDLRDRLQLGTSPPTKKLTRMRSTSSASSTSSTSSAIAIAKALGLSKSSVENELDGYSIMGGPGAPGIARTPSGKSIKESGRGRSATLGMVTSKKSSDGLGRARSQTDSRAGSRTTEPEQALNGDSVSSSPPRVGVGLQDDGPSLPVIPPFHDSSSNVRGSKLAQRSNTVGVTKPYSILAEAAEKMPKLPARSKTERGSKALHAGEHQSVPSNGDEPGQKKKTKVCVRCDKRIEDGRWIPVESPGRNGVEGKDKGVLCERCWKNMYLPKCRRCNLPIEKQAVSSSDGQLKGKYHKDCFNCSTCNEPFPNKVFYVYDGRPFCKYHYHESNGSLCAAATCGQPIEGPCAVSHTGDKYHPDHLTCEWAGHPKCDTQLSGEYWELDGRMLCEKHAHVGTGEDWEDRRWDDDEGRASGAMKRMTKFIDLNALGDLR